MSESPTESIPWGQKAATWFVELVVVAAGTKLVDRIFRSPAITAGVFIIGIALLAILNRKELKLGVLSQKLINLGAKRPVQSFIVVSLCGAALGAILFGASWLYMIHDLKKNPPPLSAPPPVIPSKQPIERTPTAAEIAEEVAKKLPSVPRPRTLPPPPTRIGTGPEAYKDVSDEQVGQWAIEEADKIEQLATRTMDWYSGVSAGAMAWHFTNDFNDCCSQDVKELRAEILRRLGPSAKNPEEISAWTALFPETKYPAIKQFKQGQEISPMSAKLYAPHLRRLGLRLKRRAVPRSAPLALQFSEQQLPPEKPGYSRIVVTIETKRELSAGYIAVQFSGMPYSVGTDFKDSKLALDSKDSIDNPLVAELLNTLTTSYVLQIGKTPFVPGRPIHVELRSASPIRVSAVRYLEE